MLNNYTLPLSILLASMTTLAGAQSAKPGMENRRDATHAQRGNAPANDECADAIPLTVGATCTTIAGDSEGATESLPASENCGLYTSPDAFDVWYSFEATSSYSRIDVLGNADYDVVVEAFTGDCGDPTPLGCSDLNFPDPGSGILDLTESLTIPTSAGNTYLIRVYYYSSPVPEDLTFTICVTDGVAPPANDDCANAAPQALTVGGSIEFTGNNEGATLDTDFGLVAVWHAFTLTECADVMLNYCIDGSEFTQFADVIAMDCEGFADPILGSSDACTVTFAQLAAGTYVVLVPGAAPQAPAGAYTIGVIATECDTYCAAASEGCDEYATNVQFGTINNDSDCGPTYQDFTDLTTSVDRGTDVSILVTNNPDAFYDGDQCAVWIDWNQDGDFEDEGEMTELATADEAATFSGMVSVPGTAELGSTRMRVRLMYTGDLLPCGIATYGDVEDYTVVVMEGTAVNELSANDWSIFPNPTNGDISIQGSQLEGRGSVSIVDMTGRMVHAANVNFTNGERTTLQLAGVLASGTYSVVITTEAGRSVRPVVVR